MGAIYRHPTICTQHEVEVNNDGSYFIKDVNDASGVIYISSLEDMSNLSDLLNILVFMESRKRQIEEGMPR